MRCAAGPFWWRWRHRSWLEVGTGFCGGGIERSAIYRPDPTQPGYQPYVTHNPGVLFMQDNARPHVARMSMDFLNEHGIDVMDWPPHSPDVNPIEHIWDILGRRIRRRTAPPQNLVQLRVALQEDRIPQRQINGLCREGSTHYKTQTVAIRDIEG